MTVRSTYRMGRMAALLVCLALPTMARGDETATKGRQIMDKGAKAVVFLKMVLKMRMSSEGQETDEEEEANETQATVIDSSGLVAASLTSVDPSHMIEMGMEDDTGFKMETEVASLRIRLGDGKEIPAKVVLRDKELDLVYVRPTEKLEAPLAAIDFTEGAKPEVLDQIVVLSRLSEAANLAPSASLDRITAVVEKPRTLFVPGLPTMMAGLGCPVFSLDGQIIGLVVVRSIPRQAGGSAGRYGDTMAVIIPAADVVAGARQAAP